MLSLIWIQIAAFLKELQEKITSNFGKKSADDKKNMKFTQNAKS